MKEKFENRRLTGNFVVNCKFEDGSTRTWQADKAEVINHVVAIVNEYSAKGLPLTLRQLHYQMVVHNWIVNHDTAYKKLGSILDDCRYAGLVDWSAIEDRGRVPFIPYSVKDVADAIKDTIEQYRLDRQIGQENQIELWTEKDALSGILRIVTKEYHVRLVVNKGYSSSSAMYSAYQRILNQILKGKKVTILYFGDHDPSGLDMVRDIEDRLMFFLSRGLDRYSFRDKVDEWWTDNRHYTSDLVDNGYCDNTEDYDTVKAATYKWYIEEHNLFTVKHIGLTKEQILQYNLPPNPTKMTDTRSAEYVKRHGKTCWEVDALKPEVLIQLVRSFIESTIDMTVYNKQLALEKKQIAELKKLVNK